MKCKMEHSLSHDGDNAHYEFIDLYNRACTLHDSSTDDSVWLGFNSDGDRMLLSSGMAAALIPLLQHFVKRGELPKKTVKLASVPVGKWVNGKWLMLGNRKLGEPHGPPGSTMRPWSFKDCGLKPDSRVTVGDKAPEF